MKSDKYLVNLGATNIFKMKTMKIQTGSYFLKHGQKLTCKYNPGSKFKKKLLEKDSISVQLSKLDEHLSNTGNCILNSTYQSSGKLQSEKRVPRIDAKRNLNNLSIEKHTPSAGSFNLKMSGWKREPAQHGVFEESCRMRGWGHHSAISDF